MHRNDPGDRSQLIDLDALMASETPPTPLPFDAPPARAPSMTPLIPIAAPPRRPQIVSVLTTVALALAGGLALAATAGGIAYSLSGGPGAVASSPINAQLTRIAVGDPTPAAPTPPVAPIELETPPVEAPPPPDDGPADVPEPKVATAPVVEPSRPERPARRTRPAPRPRQPRPAPPRPTVEDRPEPAAPTVATHTPAPRKADPADDEVQRLLDGLDRPGGAEPQAPTLRHETVTLPERLTRRQILRAVRRVSPRMKDCGGEGRYDAELRISPAGRVDSAAVRGADPAVAACVKQNVRQMNFPRFGGEAMSIELPFLL